MQKIIIAFFICVFPALSFTHEGTITDYRVVDGDTIQCDIDIGWELSVRTYIRMARYNSPELRSRNKRERMFAKRSKVKLKKILDSMDKIKIVSLKRGKYGRWIGDIYNGLINVNNKMILYEKDYPDFRKKKKSK